jgi:hypothetical protein
LRTKGAETDATKRALATFGNRFGLGLYDKEQNGVTGHRPRSPDQFAVYDSTGALFAEGLSPESFCGALRQMLEKSEGAPEIEALWSQNIAEMERLRLTRPNLRTAKGEHYSEVLARLVAERIDAFRPVSAGKSGVPSLPLRPSRIAPGGPVDKSALAIGPERRLRDKTHLKFIAKHPCLLCGRMPSHAHHLTFAQPRGLSLKVSDEFTVPLCAVHHDECHRSGDERSWWTRYGYDPSPVAAALWADTRKTRDSEPEATRAVGAIEEIPGPEQPYSLSSDKSGPLAIRPASAEASLSTPT